MRNNRLTKILAASATAGLVAVSAWAAGERSPYTEIQGRKLKALGEDEIEGYLRGRGMGFALAAELNDYPGPRHVLDLAEELGLSDEQVRKTEQIFTSMEKEAIEAGIALVQAEDRLDQLFAREEITEESLEPIILELGGLRGRVRLAHLKAHLAMKRILTAGQVEAYGRLRGYGDAEGEGEHPHHRMKHGH